MVKEKINSIRTYDEDGYRRRAACLCFKDETEQEVRKSQIVWGSKRGSLPFFQWHLTLRKTLLL